MSWESKEIERLEVIHKQLNTRSNELCKLVGKDGNSPHMSEFHKVFMEAHRVKEIIKLLKKEDK